MKPSTFTYSDRWRLQRRLDSTRRTRQSQCLVVCVATTDQVLVVCDTLPRIKTTIQKITLSVILELSDNIEMSSKMKKQLLTTMGIAIALAITPISEIQSQTKGQRYCKRLAGWNGTMERMCNAPYIGTGDLIDNGLFFNRRKSANTPRVRRCTTVGYRTDGRLVIKCK